MSYLRRPQSVKTPDSLAIRGVCGFTLCVCLSVDGIMSALCLQQYLLDPFHIYPSYQANLECVLRVKSFFFFFFLQNSKIWIFDNFGFVLFWLGIHNESIVWVIMGRRRVFSECRYSSCSSYGGLSLLSVIRITIAFLFVYSWDSVTHVTLKSHS